jgi:uncharacterized protein YebE (UPF0316 family)
VNSKLRFVIWSFIFAIPFLFGQLSFLFNPFSIFPDWIIYILMMVLGFSIILSVGDFKTGVFINLSGTLISMIIYFWISSFILHTFGSVNEVIASNLSLSTGVITTIFLYIFCLFGNIVALIFIGLMGI